MDLPIRRYGDLMFKYLYPLRRKVYLLAGLIFATLALQLVNPQIIRSFIDTAVSTEESRPLIWAGVRLPAHLAAAATGGRGRHLRR